MKLPHTLTTVTTFSKLIALFLFILLPFGGFYAGMKYQEKKMSTELKQAKEKETSEFFSNQIPTANWKTYTNNDYGFTLEYPPSLTPVRMDLIQKGNDGFYLIFDKSTDGSPEDTLKYLTHPWHGLSIFINSTKYSESFFGNSSNISKISFVGQNAIGVIDRNDNGIGDPPFSKIAFNKEDKGWLILYPNTDNEGDHDLIYDQILSTFKFLDGTPVISPTCTPRPSCLDSEPRCMIPETPDMCPKVTSTPKSGDLVVCTMDAKVCPDGSYVSRTGPKCEFSACPE